MRKYQVFTIIHGDSEIVTASSPMNAVKIRAERYGATVTKITNSKALKEFSNCFRVRQVYGETATTLPNGKVIRQLNTSLRIHNYLFQTV